MGKRSNFKRRSQDAYDTPPEAVTPLLPWLPREFAYDEPCAGSLRLALALDEATDSNALLCLASDIEPREESVVRMDALQYKPTCSAELIITNPPWSRHLLHPMIEHFSKLRPTWLLFDADWMHTKQAAPYLLLCHKIVSVGRVSWMQNGTSGKDNCAWYYFDANREWRGTSFFGRQP